jgi:hypothetical protein
MSVVPGYSGVRGIYDHRMGCLPRLIDMRPITLCVPGGKRKDVYLPTLKEIEERAGAAPTST